MVCSAESARAADPRLLTGLSQPMNIVLSIKGEVCEAEGGFLLRLLFVFGVLLTSLLKTFCLLQLLHIFWVKYDLEHFILALGVSLAVFVSLCESPLLLLIPFLGWGGTIR